MSAPQVQLQEQEGWPLGLQPLNVRIGLERNNNNNNRDYLGSMSFNTTRTTMLTASPTSTDSSSGLDTQSTGSFFHDRSITLGSLIGVSSILELSRRSIRGRRTEALKVKKPCKTRPWIFSLCSRDNSIDVKTTTTRTTTPSLAQFLAVERRNQGGYSYVPDEISVAHGQPPTNSLFENGRVAPPHDQLSPWSRSSEVENGENRGMEAAAGNNGNGVPVLFSCMCGQETH